MPERKNVVYSNNQIPNDSKQRKPYHSDNRAIIPGKNGQSQDYKTHNEENPNFPIKNPKEILRENNKNDKKEDEDDIMEMIRNQIKIQYPQNSEI